MQIYFLYRLDGCDYDEYDSFVIIAENEDNARKLANNASGLEGELWDTDNVKCEILNPGDTEEIVCASFNGG